MKQLIFSFATLIALASQAQDFTQFNAALIRYNPGYAGSVESPRLSLLYGRTAPYYASNAYVAYDQAIKRLHSGVGLEMHHRYWGIPGYDGNTMYIGLAYAAKFNLFQKLAVSPAVKFGYRKDESRYGDEHLVPEKFLVSTNNMDISAGVVVNTERFHAGFAVDHINQPVISSSAQIERTYIVQMGYTIQKHPGSEFSGTASLMFQRQGTYYTEVRPSFSARYKFAVLGAGLVMSNSGWRYNAVAGYYSRKCIIGYSIEPRRFSYPSQVYHELSLRYIFSPPKEQKAPQERTVKKHRVFKNRKRILQN